MGDLLIRGLPDDAKRRLQARARRHGVSLNAELRQILVTASDEGGSGLLRLREAALAAEVKDDDVDVLESVVADSRRDEARDPLG